MGKAQQNIVILTGAGISQESGLDTFRDSGGIWSKVRIEDVATLAAFEKNPQRVHDFYNVRREPFLNGNIKPNAAHYALARLEEYWRVGGLGAVTIITQNIDNLHELAGSQNIIHMHGEILKARCNGCNAVLEWLDALGGDEACPQCKKTKSLRPHVVWFGEVPLAMERTYQLLETPFILEKLCES